MVRQPWFLLSCSHRHTHTLCSALSSRQCDRRHAHALHPVLAPQSPQSLGSLCKAVVNTCIQRHQETSKELCAGADDEDEVDHDDRMDEEILRVEVPAVALRSQLDNIKTLTIGSGNCTATVGTAPIEDWKPCCDEEAHIARTHSLVKHFECWACEAFKAPQTRILRCPTW